MNISDTNNNCNNPIIQNLINNMVYVEGGTFMMGGQGIFNIMRIHRVTLSSFSIGKFEVTQEEWEAVMGSNPSHFKGTKRPVESVSWNDCQEFICKLNAMTGKSFRLPTEAEWEYAASGGNKNQGYKYAGSNSISQVAWYCNNSNRETHNIGSKQANELGLYDMSGNIWEWCNDWHGNYNTSAMTNPTGPTSGLKRVCRGGGWHSPTDRCRVSYRIGSYPSFLGRDLGFRLAL